MHHEEGCNRHTGGLKTVTGKFIAVALVLAVGCSLGGQSLFAKSIDRAVPELGADFISATAQVMGITLHYVRGGTGPAVILLHGFPEDWYAYHKVMPRLAQKFHVVAVDLPGIGGSGPAPGGYDAAKMADDVHLLAQQLRLQRVYVVGHDVGGMVAYAYARRYSETIRGAMILEAPLPGMAPWEKIAVKSHVWHINFQQVPDLPEQLVAGRQAIYFRYFLDPPVFSDADIARYAKSYAAPEHLHAAFEIFRAFPATGKFNAEQTSQLDLPLVIAAGSNSLLSRDLPTLAEALHEHGCVNVKTELIQGGNHYVADEQPSIVAELIEKYASNEQP
jgi:pimeloyl-ACP methyl ester carboxylesterase